MAENSVTLEDADEWCRSLDDLKSYALLKGDYELAALARDLKAKMEEIAMNLRLENS